MRRREAGRTAGQEPEMRFPPVVGRRRRNPGLVPGAAPARPASQAGFPGGLGAPPGGTTAACEELADSEARLH